MNGPVVSIDSGRAVQPIGWWALSEQKWKYSIRNRDAFAAYRVPKLPTSRRPMSNRALSQSQLESSRCRAAFHDMSFSPP